MEHQITNEHQINNVEVMFPEKYNGYEDASIISNFSPMDMPIHVFSDSLNRREANSKLLLQWIKDNFVRGVDFGTINMVGKGAKDSLYKSGAEKICGLMSLIARYPNIHLYEEAVIKGQDIKVIILKCELHTHQGFIVGEGVGARRVEQDYGDINKSIKMAEKSALVDATLKVATLSHLFTQDLETIFPQDNDNGNSHNIRQPEPPVQKIKTSETVDNKSNDNGSKRITSATYNHLMETAKSKGLIYADVKRMALERFAVMPEHLREEEAHFFITEIKTS
ncbi:Uncharacterized protein dnl_51040 [Desulfonema limicola]|uniref:Uncharacterized protein n=1 Tax=Desulfonema limicola TaxID=45656 RepID=A0A975GIM7_9BACT|nr:hypothetical protein [Desulfonema limicola]QTA82722.1 Uncharacterized protein dnl_51040 [Desulfonema limicola]